jgi:hypothetical protein
VYVFLDISVFKGLFRYKQVKWTIHLYQKQEKNKLDQNSTVQGSKIVLLYVFVDYEAEVFFFFFFKYKRIEDVVNGVRK